jgi:glycine amidinotransferase
VNEKARVLIEDFADSLQARGIAVDRPTVMDYSQKVSTPLWDHDSMFGVMSPRDVLVTVGNEILEATMTQRARWYEYLSYRDLLERYYEQDPEFVWEAAPKPRLTDASFHAEFWPDFHFEWSEEEQRERHLQRKWWTTNKEPLFDAADILRAGKDLFVQGSGVTNAKGIDWLRKHFAPKGIRVHEVHFDGYYDPWHIDTNVFIPRAGLLMQNPFTPPLVPEFHELFKINGWEIVETAPYSREEFNPYCYCGPWLSNNVLSLDPKTVCVEQAESQLMDQLQSLGLEVVPVAFHDVAPFGGGLHCATVDVFREGDCEDYFPKQISGY